jgi:hypothetical protein
VAFDATLYADLRAVTTDPAARRAFAACAPLSSADRRQLPYARWWLGGDPGSVGTVLGGASPQGRVLLVPERTRLTRRLFREGFPALRPPRGHRVVARSASWRITAEPGCLVP